MRRTARTASRLAVFALLLPPTASLRPPSAANATAETRAAPAEFEAYDAAAGVNATGRTAYLRRRLINPGKSYSRCSEGSPRSQVRTETGRYVAADEPRADCFEAYKVKSRRNRGRSSREGRTGGNPSPQSYKTPPGQVGARNKYADRRFVDYGNGVAKQCVKIATKIRERSEDYDLMPNQNRKPCMSCDPTEEDCPRGCQPFINQLYRACDFEGKMPDGWYFDPEKTITGRWNDENKAQLKIAVERCGCNAAMRGASGSPLVALVLAGALAYALVAH